jgi:hypothetical protein
LHRTARQRGAYIAPANTIGSQGIRRWNGYKEISYAKTRPDGSAGFLLLEKRETPMHVGGVNLFTLPGRRDEQTFLA